MKTMKVSEAIRKGCKLRPVQAFGVLFGESLYGNEACAMGAAYAAMCAELRIDIKDAAILEMTRLVPTSVKCPVCQMTAKHIVFHLNDGHKWTREAIADYVEENFEKPLEPPQPQVEVQEEELVLV